MRFPLCFALSCAAAAAQTVTSIDVQVISQNVPGHLPRIVTVRGSGFDAIASLRINGYAGVTSKTNTEIRALLPSQPPIFAASSAANGGLDLEIVRTNGTLANFVYSFPSAPVLQSITRATVAGLPVTAVLNGTGFTNQVRVTAFCGNSGFDVNSPVVESSTRISYQTSACDALTHVVAVGMPFTVQSNGATITGTNYSQGLTPGAGLPGSVESFSLTHEPPFNAGPITYRFDVYGRGFDTNTRIEVNGSPLTPTVGDNRRPAEVVAGLLPPSSPAHAAVTQGTFQVRTSQGTLASAPIGVTALVVPRIAEVTNAGSNLAVRGTDLAGARFWIYCGSAGFGGGTTVVSQAAGVTVIQPSRTPACPPGVTGTPVVVALRDFTANNQATGAMPSNAVALPPSVTTTNVNPSLLDLVVTAGRADSVPRTIQVNASTPTAFQITPSVPWLTVTPTSGTTPASVTVRADGSALGAGRFTVNLRVAFTGAPALDVPVVVTVTDIPGIYLATNFAEVIWRRGDPSPPLLQIPISHGRADVPLAYTLQYLNGGDWLTPLSPAGVTPGALQFRLRPENLPVGNYTANFLVRSTGALFPDTSLRIDLSVREPGIFPPGLKVIPVTAGDPDSVHLLPLQPPLGVSWDITASPEAAWLSLPAEPVRGRTVLPLRVSPARLTPGTYFADVAFSRAATPPGPRMRVALVVSPRAPLQVAQTKVEFQAFDPAVAESPQSIRVTPENAAWTPRARVLSPAGRFWLEARRVGANVEVRAQPMPAGEYWGAVDLVTEGQPVQTITVQYSVGPAVNPAAGAPPALVLAADEAGAMVSERVDVPGFGEGSFFYAIPYTEDGGNWLSASPAAGTLNQVPKGVLFLRANPAGLAPGVYRGVVSVMTRNFLRHDIAVTLLVRRTGLARQRCRESGDALAAVTLLAPQWRASLARVPADFSVAVRVLDPCGEPVTATSGVARTVQLFNAADNTLTPLTFNGGDTWTGVVNANEGLQLAVEAHVLLASGVVQSTPYHPLLRTHTARRAEEGMDAPWTVAAAPAAPLGGAGVLSPGVLATVYGSLIGPREGVAAPAGPLPDALGGVTILLGDRRIKPQYVSSGQVNFLVPFDQPVNFVAPLVMEREGRRSAPLPVLIHTATPGLFTTFTGQGAVLIAGTAEIAGPRESRHFGLPGRPARVREALTIFCGGLGIVTNLPLYGAPAAAAAPFSTVPTPLKVWIGGRESTILFAGLAPGFIGLYQINALVPEGVEAGGRVPLEIEAGGLRSAPATIAVE